MNNKHLNFLSYLKTPLSRESISIIYDANNVNYDRCVLYGDFVVSLIYLVNDTYLGDNITSKDNQKKHFEWCWSKNIENFKSEGVQIESDKLYEYFIEYMFEVFYSVDKTKENDNIRIWEELFDYNRNRTQSDMDTFVEVYKIFEKSLKNGIKA